MALRWSARVGALLWLVQPVALICTGLAIRQRHRLLGRSAVAAGTLALLGTVLFLARANSPTLGGLYERLALWPAYLWLAVAAAVILAAVPALDRWRSPR